MYQKDYEVSGYRDAAGVTAGTIGFVNRVYGWMCFALFLTGGTAWFVAADRTLVAKIVEGGWFLPLLIGELLLVMAISFFIDKMSAATATALFALYSAVNGLTFSVIFLAYTMTSIASTFAICAGTFGAMAIYGSVTKRDLTSIGNICFMALIGLIIASIVNFFVASSILYWVVTYAGVLIFVGLTAYDAQKVKKMATMDMDSETAGKAAVLGALSLYLDFINLFLFLLRIFGRRR